MNDILQQSIPVQVLVLLVLSAVVACVAWTVTHEEVFREVRDFCVRRSQTGRTIVVRKFFYLFTCEYCFSHYVAGTVVIAAHYRLLVDDWRGFIAAVFVIVWIANFQMAAFARLRLEVKLDRIEIDEKTDENGQTKVTDSDGNSAGGSTRASTKARPEPRL